MVLLAWRMIRRLGDSSVVDFSGTYYLRKQALVDPLRRLNREITLGDLANGGWLRSQGCVRMLRTDRTSSRDEEKPILLLGPGGGGGRRSEIPDEKWDDFMVRIFSHRLRIELKRRCDESRKFAVVVMDRMTNLYELKRMIVLLATGEEEKNKDYNSDTASKSLARLIGPFLIAVFAYCVKTLWSKGWEIYEEKQAKLELEKRLAQLEAHILSSADAASTQKVLKIMKIMNKHEEDMESMKKKHEEDMENMKKQHEEDKRKHKEDMGSMKKKHEEDVEALWKAIIGGSEN